MYRFSTFPPFKETWVCSSHPKVNCKGKGHIWSVISQRKKQVTELEPDLSPGIRWKHKNWLFLQYFPTYLSRRFEWWLRINHECPSSKTHLSSHWHSPSLSFPFCKVGQWYSTKVIFGRNTLRIQWDSHYLNADIIQRNREINTLYASCGVWHTESPQ